MGELSVEKLILFILIALPGAISIRVYALWCPTSQKDWKDSLTDAIIYSLIGLAIWVMAWPEPIHSFVRTAFNDGGENGSRQGLAVALLEHKFLLISYTVATPVALAFFWYFLRRHVFPRLFGFDHPTRTAWDWLFTRKKNMFIFIFFKDKDGGGNPICKGGYFGRESYVSTFPYEQEIFIERTYEIIKGIVQIKRDDNGVEIPGLAKGLLVRVSEIERIEVYNIPASILSNKPRWRRCLRAVGHAIKFIWFRVILRCAVASGHVLKYVWNRTAKVAKRF